MLWRLDSVLQRGHDLAAIALEQGWGIEPEPRKDCGLEQPMRVRLPFPVRAVLQDKPAHHALAQDDHHIFQHASLLIVPALPGAYTADSAKFNILALTRAPAHSNMCKKYTKRQATPHGIGQGHNTSSRTAG